MNAMKKLKSKRGMTLAEVLTVVAIMAILLGVAMPNLLSESQKIKLTAMDGNARSVAVAVQSRLYGMKNAGTGLGSEYYSLNNLAASDIDITVNGANKKVKYVSNFANGSDKDAKDRATLAKQLLFSGAITDTELLQNGYIVVVYDPATAYVIWTFYSEDEFDINSLICNLVEDDNETYRKSNMIGVYQGEYAPEPERKARVPEFSCRFVFDDELYLEMALAEEPSDELEGKRLGIEVYAEIPKINGEGANKEETKEEIDEIGIYYQGIFKTEYKTTYAGTIASDDNAKLTIEDIKKNGGFLRFALDSMVTNKAGYDNTKEYLRHQNHPEYVSVAEPLLYPRESLDNWFNPTVNPYLTVWSRENAGHIPTELTNKIKNSGTKVTEYVGVDETMRLRVRIFVLKDETHEAKKGANGEETNADLYTEDENFAPFETESEAVSPYFNALSKNENKKSRVTLSALRDLNNLKYVFTTENSIDEADLNRDISGQQFYDKLVAVRYALLEKKHNDSLNSWPLYSNRENIICDTLSPNKPFTLSGKNSKGGNYAIVGISGGGRNETLGGLFGYAEGCKFENLDIVNPVTWRNGFSSSFLTGGENGNITEINASYGSAISGSLVGIAVNCTFDNVHSYIDPSRALEMEGDGNTPENHTTRYPYNFGYNRTSGVVAGGLVGLAITSQDTKEVKAKSSETKTTFKDCSASVIVCSELNSYTSKCIYAGGLIGMTMGGVEITDCYAASQLSGYYSGGLVGCVVKEGNWKYDEGDFGTGTKMKKEGTGNGKLTITNSFASGIIQRQTRIGGGLIADIDGSEEPTVTGCYSSVKWEILPPVAYGTFKGDENNYYISQTYIVVPITVNVEAHFKCTGDVFSLNEDTKSGIPCANEKDLETKLKNGLTNAGEKELKTKLTASDWTTATNTRFWQWESNILTSENKEDSENKENSENTDSGYPFPMRTNNNTFSGSWIGEMQVNLRGNEGQIETVYDEDATEIPSKFESECEGFYCAFYAGGEYYYPNSKDNGTIVSMKFNRWNGNLFMGSVTLDAKQLATDWWRTDSEKKYGQGDEGVIKVTYEDSTKEFTFTGFDYNSPVFDPFEQDKFKLTDKEGLSEDIDKIIKDPKTTLNWDYYGFYFGNTDKNFKHYIKFSNDVGEGQIEKSGDYILVSKEDFTEYFSDKQQTYTVTPLQEVLKTDYSEKITCDENGCFCAEECKDNGEKKVGEEG